MSVPFQTYQVTIDGSGTPYINSFVEVGTFSGTADGGDFNSLFVTKDTNAGLVSKNSDGCGLKFNYKGIYRLSTTINFYTNSSDAGNLNHYFAFGTQKLNNKNWKNDYNSNNLPMPDSSFYFYGGTKTIGSRGYGDNNFTTPGIINWTFTPYSSGNNQTGTFYINSDSNGDKSGIYAVFYSNINAEYEFYPFICQTSILLAMNQNDNLYLNISPNSGTTSTGSCPWVLELLSTTLPSV
jgi:hypothetical protein